MRRLASQPKRQTRECDRNRFRRFCLSPEDIALEIVRILATMRNPDGAHHAVSVPDQLLGGSLMTDPKLVNSPLSCVVVENGDRVEIAIYRLEDGDWKLEVVAADGCLTIWAKPFNSDEAALAEAWSRIKDEGVKSFFEAAKKGALR